LSAGSAIVRVARGVSWNAALAWQLRAVDRLGRDPSAPEAILLAEHRPIITRGRGTKPGDLRWTDAELAARGIALRDARRGGSVTFHGPGQWTLYPVLRLDRRGRDLHRHMRLLEETGIRFLARLGLEGFRVPGRSGVWVAAPEAAGGRAKIAALGVAVTRWIAWQGLAVNIAPDLRVFREGLVPCGIPAAEGGVTSLAERLGGGPDMDETGRILLACALEVFGLAAESAFPAWIRRRLPPPDPRVEEALHALRLDTVCRGARCPNRAECHGKGRATFLLLGPGCTRRCGFCAVERRDGPGDTDADEPARVAEAVRRLGLRHAVITSVTRDDLPDGGAGHFARTVAAVRAAVPGVTVEILVPDFAGNFDAAAIAIDAAPDVFNHNVETVPRLYSRVRPQADWHRSLDLLAFARRRRPAMRVKSGLMVGLGETEAEVIAAARELRAVGVDLVTVGQYLRPGPSALPVERFWPPEAFARLETALRGLGFSFVAAAPFVRSSYDAAEALEAARDPQRAADG